ncbi:MAG: sulfatase, partial [Gammaproteobacteria bacterium]|nr:sulfatase [Gammaproteobacteria bacterium]
MSRKPNFLYIMVDQQRADWLGCYGHPVVKTPNIDAIAVEGTRFDEFHVATPVCMPNRASLMTGRMPSVHGLRYNGCLLSERANTFVDVLRAGGYATATIGKSHLQPFTDFEAEKQGEELNGPIAEAWKPDQGDYGREEPERYLGGDHFDFPTPYYGFDHVDMVTGHGDRA